MAFVLPGMTVSRDSKCLPGPGLVKHDQRLISTQAGCLLFDPSTSSYFIETRNNKYMPTNDEQVVGIIASIAGDTYKVDIQSCRHASLSNIAFEGATKSNKPNLRVGDLIFGAIHDSVPNCEPQLTCDKPGLRLGQITMDNATLLRLKPYYARKLLNRKWPLFSLIGQQIPVKVIVGVNGYAVISSQSIKETIVVKQIIEESENAEKHDLKHLVFVKCRALNYKW